MQAARLPNENPPGAAISPRSAISCASLRSSQAAANFPERGTTLLGREGRVAIRPVVPLPQPSPRLGEGVFGLLQYLPSRGD